MATMQQLKDLNMLKNIRSRMGLEEDDSSRDEVILKMSDTKLVSLDSAWELGDEHWAKDILSKYDYLINN